MATLPSRIDLPDMRNYGNAVNPYSSNNNAMWGAIASAGSSLLGSLFSSYSQKKAIAAQREENALNRQFNMEEAQKSRDFQREMFNAENEYNDPKRVVSRLMAAGINPALAFGDFANSASAAGGSAPASSSGGISPVMPDWSGIQSAGRSFLDAELLKAQTRNINAQAAKTESETPWVDQLNSIEAQLKQSGIDLNLSSVKVNEEQAKVLVDSAKKIQADIDLVREQGILTSKEIEIATSEANIKSLESEYADQFKSEELRQLKASIEKTISETDLSNGELSRIMALYTYERAALKANARNVNAQAYGSEMSNSVTQQLIKSFGLGKLSLQQWNSVQSVINRTVSETNSNVQDQNYRIWEFGLSSAETVLDIGSRILMKKGKKAK